MTVAHPDLQHPSRRRRSFARFAMWFADWQGTPTFVAILTIGWLAEIALNQLVLPLLGVSPFDPSTWLLNLGLSLLAAYAASLSVMGSKVQSAALLDEIGEMRDELHGLRVALAQRRGGEPVGETTDGGDW